MLFKTALHNTRERNVEEMFYIFLRRVQSEATQEHSHRGVLILAVLFRVGVNTSIVLQGGHGTGKTGNLVLTFSGQGKHREFCSDTGKIC